MHEIVALEKLHTLRSQSLATVLNIPCAIVADPKTRLEQKDDRLQLKKGRRNRLAQLLQHDAHHQILVPYEGYQYY